jgi:MOSC domain-containing protein YiiM
MPATEYLMAKIIAVCTSECKGTRKSPVDFAVFETGVGLVGDAHAAGDSIREVSLLAIESIDTMNNQDFTFHPGDFAENLTTSGINLVLLPVGTRLQVGKDVILEVTQIGKKCHTECAIFKEVGKCVMPKEGVFARVVKGGTVRADDDLSTMPPAD